MPLIVMAGFRRERFPQAMTHRQAPASKTVHHLLYVLDLRRRSEAMADEPSPLLELGRIPETDSVVFDRLP